MSLLTVRNTKGKQKLLSRARPQHATLLDVYKKQNAAPTIHSESFLHLTIVWSSWVLLGLAGSRQVLLGLAVLKKRKMYQQSKIIFEHNKERGACRSIVVVIVGVSQVHEAKADTLKPCATAARVSARR